MNGARRVVIFCLLTAVLPTILIIIPLYLRHNVFSDVVYEVAESDVLEIGDDISTVFCQEHTIKMNTSFSAYQVDSKPEISNKLKHIRLKKSMRLPDDTLEYWGFFLPKGSIVKLSVCSRYDGSRILVVRGEKNLRTCGLLDHSKGKEPHPVAPPTVLKAHYEPNVNEGKEMPANPPVSVFYSNPSEKETERPKLDENNMDLTAGHTTRKSRSIDDEDNNAAENDEQDSDGLKTFLLVSNLARQIVEERSKSPEKLRTLEESLVGHKLRHSRSRNSDKSKFGEVRTRRAVNLVQPHNLDAKVMHGGNAGNHIDSAESSASSFEKDLLDCYGGDILLTHSFPPSQYCNVTFLVSNSTGRLTTTHNIDVDGYYYYIFYSDNDLIENDIHAVFDIHKPTYQLANISKNCVNETTCTFPVTFFANEIVIVEVPTRDGIENEDEDISMLVSVCHPRMAVYIIFPLLVLILILGCAFL